MNDPASSPRAGTRRVSATFTHSAVPDDLKGHDRGGASFLSVLLRRFPYQTAEQWTARIADGRVTLNGLIATPETPVRTGDLITSRITDYEEPAVPVDFGELVAAGDLALVHKPAGLPVHKTGKIFVNVLANLYRAFKGDDGWTPLNRLDVETSGIVAFARGRDALRRFSPASPACLWSKAYLAVVDGVMDAPRAHDGPLAEWPGHAIRSRMRVHEGGKPARTSFQPLAARDGRTLVLARPVTGRKHQIRAHLADLGFPIVGDKVYNHGGHYYLKRLDDELTAEDVEALGAPHQLLHAASLNIEDRGLAGPEATAGNGTGISGVEGRPSGVSAQARGAGASGVSGVDFDLPEGFRRYFPEATEAWLRGRLNPMLDEKIRAEPTM